MIDSKQYLLLLVSTFLMVNILAPIMRKIAVKTNFVDEPIAAHKSHSQATPYLGGVAIVIAFLVVTYTAMIAQGSSLNYLLMATSVFGPSLFLGIIGLVDDYMSLSPFPRFIAQSIAGIFTAIFIISTNSVGNPTGNSILDMAITIFWIVGICNAINFFDNLDGGAAGAVAIASMGLFVISQVGGQYLIASAAVTLLGAMLGFLIWNFSPAMIFMGDAGALFLGTILATLTVRLDPIVENQMASFAIPILLLAVPILDTSVAVISRIRRGKSVFMGGRDHLSHRLLRKGLSVRQTMYTLWLISSFFMVISVTISVTDSLEIGLILLASITWILLLISFLRATDD